MHRTSPRPETMCYVPGYPRTLRLYQVPASSVWQMRAYVGGKLIKQSTHTDSKVDAIKAAKAFYNGLLLKQAQGTPLTEGKAFQRMANAVLDEERARVDRNELAATAVSDMEYMLEKDLLPFFKDDALKSIGYQRITEFMARLAGRKVGSNTIKNNFIILRKILKHAHKLNLLDKLPIFPKVATVDNPREWFTKQQYVKLRQTLAECEGQLPEGGKVHHRITAELRYLATFLVNTFLRPADIKDLKHSDIDVVEGEQTYLRIRCDSKVKPSVVVSMPDAVGIYRDIRALNAGHCGPGDYVFLPALTNRGYAFQTLRLQFNHVLEKAELKKGSGPDRTLYSLRHTAIMFRLLNGGTIDLLTLARNCRTSVAMIERFYASHLEAEMQVEAIQSMK